MIFNFSKVVSDLFNGRKNTAKSSANLTLPVTNYRPSGPTLKTRTGSKKPGKDHRKMADDKESGRMRVNAHIRRHGKKVHKRMPYA